MIKVFLKLYKDQNFYFLAITVFIWLSLYS